MPTLPTSYGKHKKEKSGWKPDSIRGNRHQRGYDKDWEKLRKIKLAKDPLCEMCTRKNKVTEATDVDHIIPFKGLNDPNRLNMDNLQSLCRRCHQKKTGSRS